jgi:hypothetical protein
MGKAYAKKELGSNFFSPSLDIERKKSRRTQAQVWARSCEERVGYFKNVKNTKHLPTVDSTNFSA